MMKMVQEEAKEDEERRARERRRAKTHKKSSTCTISNKLDGYTRTTWKVKCKVQVKEEWKCAMFFEEARMSWTILQTDNEPRGVPFIFHLAL